MYKYSTANPAQPHKQQWLQPNLQRMRLILAFTEPGAYFSGIILFAFLHTFPLIVTGSFFAGPDVCVYMQSFHILFHHTISFWIKSLNTCQPSIIGTLAFVITGYYSER
jgi:hypothetical protein